MTNPILRSLTADIVTAHVANNVVAVSDVPVLIGKIYGALAGLSAPVSEPQPTQRPAVDVRASVKPDYLVSLESGRKLKLLKRYLLANYRMTPDQYREKWKLPPDYPMVAPNYAKTRSTLAKSIGLGRIDPAATKPVKAPMRRKPGRPRQTQS